MRTCGGLGQTPCGLSRAGFGNVFGIALAIALHGDALVQTVRPSSDSGSRAYSNGDRCQFPRAQVGGAITGLASVIYPPIALGDLADSTECKSRSISPMPGVLRQSRLLHQATTWVPWGRDDEHAEWRGGEIDQRVYRAAGRSFFRMRVSARRGADR